MHDDVARAPSSDARAHPARRLVTCCLEVQATRRASIKCLAWLDGSGYCLVNFCRRGSATIATRRRRSRPGYFHMARDLAVPAGRAARGLSRPPPTPCSARRPVGRVSRDRAWPWPEPRLTYSNAVLAEARIAAGVELGDDRLLDEGLDLLDWLVRVETRDGHFSFTPAGGWASGEARPGFDQQPLEAGTMADACARAFDATGDPIWADRTELAAAWFLGRNDVGVPLLDPRTGGCRDGLERGGVNENEGAESTIAMISALQQARSGRCAQSLDQQPGLDLSRADAAIGSAVRQVDVAVRLLDRALHEDHVVDVAAAFPRKLWAEDGLIQGGHERSRLVVEGDVDRVARVGVALVVEEQQGTVDVERRRSGADTRPPAAGRISVCRSSSLMCASVVVVGGARSGESNSASCMFGWMRWISCSTVVEVEEDSVLVRIQRPTTLPDVGLSAKRPSAYARLCKPATARPKGSGRWV